MSATIRNAPSGENTNPQDSDAFPVTGSQFVQFSTLKDYVLSAKWFDVTDYGAAGDGTTDDTTAISSAVAALVSAGKGVLYFPAGTYLTTGGFTLSVPCTVIGDGAEGFDGTDIVTRVVSSSATAVLFTVSSDMVRFSNIALVCTAATPTAGSGVYVSSAYIHQQVNYENIVVRGFYDNIDIAVGAQWTLHNSYILDPVRYGVRIRNTVNNDAGDWSISNCNFNPLTRSATAAIRLESSGGGKITNCKINCSAPPGTYKFVDGISMAAAGATSILLISNCSIENYSGDGIDLTGPDWNMVLVSNCQFGQYGNGTGSAIKINNLTDVVISGNAFRANTGTPTAISLTSVTRAFIGAMTNNGFATVLSQTTCTDIVDRSNGGQAQDDFLDDIAALTDPNADRVLFWDDSAGAFTWLTIGTGLTITDTTINASAAGGQYRTHATVTDSDSDNVDGWKFSTLDGGPALLLTDLE